VKHSTQRRRLLDAAKRMGAEGLSPGTSGNVSVRVNDRFLITPTGMAYAALTAEDLVEVTWDGAVPRGQRQPSSEWRMHRDIYQRRAEAHAIFHTHSMFCTTLSCLRRPIPAVHYMIAVTGSAVVPCAKYATYGTAALSAAVVEALRGTQACLLANHGMVAMGASLVEAYRVASEVENLAAQYWRALQIGEPVVLDDREMARVIEKFRTYGQSANTSKARTPVAAKPGR
jgi:L-fuculose-phosphate aldolase